MKITFAIALIALLALAGASAAQTTRPGGGASGGGTSTTNAPKPTAQPADPSTIINRDSERMKQQGRAGDRLTGNVDVTGGAAPWEPITITVLCDGTAKYTTGTDSKGLFAIVSSEDRGPNTVKADPKPVAAQFVGCNVQAALPGFNSSSLPIGTRYVLDSTNIGTIHLSREENS